MPSAVPASTASGIVPAPTATLMITLRGADAEVAPASLPPLDVFGVYVGGEGAGNIWTKAQVAALPVSGVLPIVVPRQDLPWWTDGDNGYAYLLSLALAADDWGVPSGCSLVIDIEEGQAEAMGDSRGAIATNWRNVCQKCEYHPWAYSGSFFLSTVESSTIARWLAQWPATVPTDPQVPPGFSGWQYRGDPHGGIDLDVFMPGIYMSRFATGSIALGVPQEVDVPWIAHVTDKPDEEPYWLVDNVATVVEEGHGALASFAANGFRTIEVPWAVIADRVVRRVAASGLTHVVVSELESAADNAPEAAVPAIAESAPVTEIPPPPPAPPGEGGAKQADTGGEVAAGSGSGSAPDPKEDPTPAGSESSTTSSGPEDWAARRSRGEV